MGVDEPPRGPTPTSMGFTVMVRAESSQSISFSFPVSWSRMVLWCAARIRNTPRMIMKTRKLTHTTMTTVAVLGTTGVRGDRMAVMTGPVLGPCALGLPTAGSISPQRTDRPLRKGSVQGFGPLPPCPCSSFLMFWGIKAGLATDYSEPGGKRALSLQQESGQGSTVLPANGWGLARL